MLWGIQRVKPQAAYDLTVDRIRRQIHSGLLLPSEKLPAERQLSDDFGISRVTLREALRVLETDRYITIKRGSQGGAFVAEHDDLGSLAAKRIARKPSDAMRVLEFLCSNEETATGLATVRGGVPEFKRMQSALDMIERVEGPAELKQGETLYHLALGQASQNTLFAAAIADGMSELFMPYPDVDFGNMRNASALWHRKLLAAIMDGNRDMALETLGEIHDLWWRQMRNFSRKAA
ncbi:MAG: GntR family transcriptional regulator [Pseudomonadota bacterium]